MVAWVFWTRSVVRETEEERGRCVHACVRACMCLVRKKKEEEEEKEEKEIGGGACVRACVICFDPTHDALRTHRGAPTQSPRCGRAGRRRSPSGGGRRPPCPPPRRRPRRC